MPADLRTAGTGDDRTDGQGCRRSVGRWSWEDFYAGRITRTRTEVVAGSPLTLTAALDKRTQTVWVISLSGG